MPRPQIRLITRVGCHLCDDAHALLVKHGLQPELVDIDQQPELLSQHSDWVPVVEIDGVIRFRGKIDELLLRRLIPAQ